MSSFSNYTGKNKFAAPTRSPANERRGRMQRLNERLKTDPEFAAQFAADRAERMKVINAKPLRRTALHLNCPAKAPVRKPTLFDDLAAIRAALDLAAEIATGEPSRVIFGNADEALARMRERFRA